MTDHPGISMFVIGAAVVVAILWLPIVGLIWEDHGADDAMRACNGHQGVAHLVQAEWFPSTSWEALVVCRDGSVREP